MSISTQDVKSHFHKQYNIKLSDEVLEKFNHTLVNIFPAEWRRFYGFDEEFYFSTVTNNDRAPRQALNINKTTMIFDDVMTLSMERGHSAFIKTLQRLDSKRIYIMTKGLASGLERAYRPTMVANDVISFTADQLNKITETPLNAIKDVCDKKSLYYIVLVIMLCHDLLPLTVVNNKETVKEITDLKNKINTVGLVDQTFSTM